MSDKPTWRFAPTGDGIEYIQDQSSAHFNDDPVPKLVREVLQNSLDANDTDLADPVLVIFKESFVDPNLIEATELKKHLTACSNRAKSENNANLRQSYNRALNVLKEKKIRCLQVVDSGTKGLISSNWDALVYQEGSVQKAGSAPGVPSELVRTRCSTSAICAPSFTLLAIWGGGAVE